jgi:PAS domain S-box-containing protein
MRRTRLFALLLAIVPLSATPVLGPGSVFEQYGGVMLLIEANSGTIVQANAAAKAYYGYGEALEGMRIQDINTLSPEQVALERQAALEQKRNYFLFRHRLASGEIREVEVYSWPYRAEGRDYLVSIIHDVSPLFVARRELEENQARSNKAELVACYGYWEFDLTSKSVKASVGAQALYGLTGDSWDIPSVQKIPLPEYRPALDKELADLIAGRAPYDIEFEIKRPTDGKVRAIRSVAEYDPEENKVLGIIRDVTEERASRIARETGSTVLYMGALLFIAGLSASVVVLLGAIRKRKAAEAEVRALLAEKETLMTEVQHRIKNNMATVSGLLRLQATRLGEGPAASALVEAEGRVHSMMLLYERLYNARSGTRVSLKGYLESLARDIVENAPERDKIELRAAIEDIEIDTKRASALGIIVNEIVTNSAKYAFAGRDRGAISLMATRREGELVIEVSDDGPGIPDLEAASCRSGFGMTMIEALCLQLEAKMHVENAGGLKYRLELPLH